MNIVYLLTNTNKEKGKRFYIGSKTECNVVSFYGIDTIIDLKTGKPYYSSSQSLEMKSDLKAGNVFSAKILEIVMDRKELITREDFWIERLNAVKSEDYYNISNAVLNCHDQEVIVNSFRERLKDLASRNSALSKKDATAESLGFNNFGELALHIWAESKNKTFAEVSRSLGKHRHFAKTYVKLYDETKTLEDLNKSELKSELRDFIAKGCSLFLAAEKLNLSYPAARMLLGDFNKINERSYSVAKSQGLSKEELEIKITKAILDGAGFREVSKEFGIVYESVKRYFFRCVRKRLKSSDL